MSIAKKIDNYISQSSWIRKMFEEGITLKKQYGAENVFDFSIGNPNVAPPHAFIEALIDVAKKEIPNKHGYMPNAGYLEVREVLAKQISVDSGVSIFPNNIVMTCGAGGALNVILKTLLDDGDEVVILSPFFVEYKFYISNYSGVTIVAKTNNDFSLNIENIGNAINQKTKAILINSPNNPTGRIYDADSIIQLSHLLKVKSEEYKKAIYLISDEPYAEIVFDDITERVRRDQVKPE
ncbi:MAG: aminotransferase class I/II-fold pyridoxal phosphate-dependent enzyme [Deltaproteobacteria bacterium]